MAANLIVCAVLDRTFGGMTEYIYDAEGTRVAKGTIYAWTCDTTQNGFALSNTYIIGPSGEQLTETDGSGNWLHTNVFAAGQLLATYRRVAQVPGEVITTTESGCPNH